MQTSLQPAFLAAGCQSLSTQLWALPCPSSQQNLQIQCAVSAACSAKVFRYPFPFLRIIPALTWEGRTCLCSVVFAAFMGPPLTRPGKKGGWECILQAVGKVKSSLKLNIWNNWCLGVFPILTDHLQRALWRCAAEDWATQSSDCCWPQENCDGTLGDSSAVSYQQQPTSYWEKSLVSDTATNPGQVLCEGYFNITLLLVIWKVFWLSLGRMGGLVFILLGIQFFPSCEQYKIWVD